MGEVGDTAHVEENIEVLELPIDDAMRMIGADQIKNTKTVIFAPVCKAEWLELNQSGLASLFSGMCLFVNKVFLILSSF